jgi:hypothetical protein
MKRMDEMQIYAVKTQKSVFTCVLKNAKIDTLATKKHSFTHED